MYSHRAGSLASDIASGPRVCMVLHRCLELSDFRPYCDESFQPFPARGFISVSDYYNFRLLIARRHPSILHNTRVIVQVHQIFWE